MTALSRNGRRGFSLVEMLVAITIIALLIALILPSVKRTKRQIRFLVCLTQQRQIAMAVLGYTVDHHDNLPFGFAGTPTIIGAGAEVIMRIQGSNVWHGDHDGPPADAAMHLFTCPDFLTRPGTAISIWDPYDRPLYSKAPYYGWGPGCAGGSNSLPCEPGETAVHSTFMYVGGIGLSDNTTNGTSRWHGWNAYDSDTYAAYDSPFGIGPVPAMSDRMRHSQTGLLTDRMWLTDPTNQFHPFRRTDVGGHEAVPNHKVGDYDTRGGNVVYVDGHGEWKWVNQIEERVHAWSGMRPYVCY